MKTFLKPLSTSSIIFSFLTISLQAAPAQPPYSKDAIFLSNKQENIIKNTNIQTTLGPIENLKFQGIISSTGSISSADDIDVAQVLASISAQLNITAPAGAINLSANKTSLTTNNGLVSCKNNITIGGSNSKLTSGSSIITTTGSITIDGSSSTITAKGKIWVPNSIVITPNATGSSIAAAGDINCDFSIATSAVGSTITSGGSIRSLGTGTLGSGFKVQAEAVGSIISAPNGTIFADVVEASVIKCNTLVTHTRNRAPNGSIRITRTVAGGTIIADTIIANKVSAGTITTTQPTQTVSDLTIANALSPVLNSLHL